MAHPRQYEMRFLPCLIPGCVCGGITIPARDVVGYLAATAAAVSESNPAPWLLDDEHRIAVQYARRVLEEVAAKVLQWSEPEQLTLTRHWPGPIDPGLGG